MREKDVIIGETAEDSVSMGSWRGAVYVKPPVAATYGCCSRLISRPLATQSRIGASLDTVDWCRSHTGRARSKTLVDSNTDIGVSAALPPSGTHSRCQPVTLGVPIGCVTSPRHVLSGDVELSLLPAVAHRPALN